MHHARYALVTLLPLAACATTLTAQDVGTYGTRQLAAPPERVFAASRTALTGMGFRIAREDPERGLLVTEPGMDKLLFNDVPVASDPGTSMSVTPEQRGYSVEITPAGQGRVEVRVTPQLFRNGVDVSRHRVWVLGDEKKLWASFFAAVERAL